MSDEDVIRVQVYRIEVVEIPRRVLADWQLDDQGWDEASESIEAIQTFVEETYVSYFHHEILSEDGQRVERAFVRDETIIVEPLDAGVTVE